MTRLSRSIRSTGCALALAVLFIQPALAGTLYVTGIDSTTGSTMVQVLNTSGAGSIVTSWNTQNPNELALAIGATVRTINQTSASGLGSEYSLNGTFLGTTYQQLVDTFLTDGTQSATNNFAIDPFNGGVYSFDRTWGGGTLLFADPFGPFGITYDPTNNSLWIAELFRNVIADFALDGTPLGAPISTGALFPSGLALDPADHTFWTGDFLNPGNFAQFGSGGLLQTQTLPSLASFSVAGMEFAQAAVPEPAVFGMAGFGLFALIALKYRTLKNRTLKNRT